MGVSLQRKQRKQGKLLLRVFQKFTFVNNARWLSVFHFFRANIDKLASYGKAKCRVVLNYELEGVAKVISIFQQK